VKKLLAVLAFAAFATFVWIALPSIDEAQSTGRGNGVVQWIDTEQAIVTLRHGPVPALNMEAMTMSFRVADRRQLLQLQPMQEIVFELSYHPRTGYTITDIR
jgi:Cu(I)/Ag(I) efflux system periplasmic protein CusF